MVIGGGGFKGVARPLQAQAILLLRTYDISTNLASPEALPSDHYG
jgi:hypothetical protein